MDTEKRGVLFENKFKTKPKQPDFRGFLHIGDEQIDIVAWMKSNRKGKYISFAVDEIKMKEKLNNDEADKAVEEASKIKKEKEKKADEELENLIKNKDKLPF